MSVFDKNYKRYDSWYEKNKYIYLSELEAIKKVVPKSGKGLEIGVGTGRFAEPLGIKNGVEPSKNMAHIARERGIDVKIGRGEKIPFRNTTFDYVAIIIALCFVQNPQKVLKESRRVLKKKGKLIIGIIDKNSFLGKLYQKKKSAFYKQAHFFSATEVTELLKATGFNRFSYYETLFKHPGKITSVEKPRKGCGKGSFVVISSQK